MAMANNISGCYSNFANPLQAVYSTIYTVILYLLFQLNYVLQTYKDLSHLFPTGGVSFETS